MCKFIIVVVMCFLCPVAKAQLRDFSGFFQKHFQVQTTDAPEGPVVNSRFSFSSGNALLTRNTMKMNQEGFEDHMAVGIRQNIAGARSIITYNIYRYNYKTLDTHSRDVSLDLQYHAIHLQHRMADTSQMSSIGFPIALPFGHFSFAVSQTIDRTAGDSMDLYQVTSRIRRLTFIAQWQDMGTDTWTDYTTQYRLSGCCLMKYMQSEHGMVSQRAIRGEYVGRHVRLAGEYTVQTAAGAQGQISGAIDIVHDTRLAALKLRIEYSDAEASAVYFRLESPLAF